MVSVSPFREYALTLTGIAHTLVLRYLLGHYAIHLRDNLQGLDKHTSMPSMGIHHLNGLMRRVEFSILGFTVGAGRDVQSSDFSVQGSWRHP